MSSLDIISPVNGELYASLAQTSDAAIAAALEKARLAQEKWAVTPIETRAKLCRGLVQTLVDNAEKLGGEMSWQIGRPCRYTPNEIKGGFAERAHYMIDIAAQALSDIRPGDGVGVKRFIRKKPLGIVFLVAAWNYPYLTAVNALIPALMAGNCVILKHARQSLLVGEALANAARAANLPEGVLTHLVLTHAQAARIIADAAIDHVNFTGSVAGGHEVQNAARTRFISMGLELGGKDAAYVRADADIDYAAEQLVDGSFFNSGQSCCGIERIYVARAQFDAFVARAVELTRGYQLGDPLDPETTLGPVINAAAASTIRRTIAEAVQQGASPLIDEEAFPYSLHPAGTYLAPQILINVTHDMRIMREETFGPVVGIMPVESDAEAVSLMNDSVYGLTASVWTRDPDVAEAIGNQLRVGTLFMNRCDYVDPALAWTGWGDTGRGTTLSSLGYDHLTRPMSFHLKTETS